MAVITGSDPVTIFCVLGSSNDRRRAFGHHLCGWLELISGKKSVLFDLIDVAGRDMYKTAREQANSDFVLEDPITIEMYKSAFRRKDGGYWSSRLARYIADETTKGCKHAVVTGLKTEVEIKEFIEKYYGVMIYLNDPTHTIEDEEYRPITAWAFVNISEPEEIPGLATEVAEKWFKEISDVPDIDALEAGEETVDTENNKWDGQRPEIA